jgi:mannose-1-phosphate guanylyltransferase/mannose-6-phosphate isomerase
MHQLSSGKKNPTIVPVILSGGSGTRLWPMSREDRPKQFCGLLNPASSLMEDTISRVADTTLFHPPVILGNHAHRFLIAEKLAQAGVVDSHIIVEPCIRNTAPAIAAAALYIADRYGDALMLVLPTDQAILNCDAFLTGVEQAAKVAQKGYLVTFGIKPGYAETGYGYIRKGESLDSNQAFKVAEFVEKPSSETAESYIATGDYFWNSGMFVFPAKLMLEELKQCQPDVVEACQEAIAKSVTDKEYTCLDEQAFNNAPVISIDYALMERTRKSALVPLDCGWSDTGAWESLWRISPKDNRDNVAIGECHLVESDNCYIRNERGPVIATYGVDNLVIVATRDAVLVARKDNAHSLKTLVEHVRKTNPKLVAENCRVYRPWGMYESVNSGQRYQVKCIHVKPGEKLSLQMHYHRAEHWVVVSGTAKVVCDDKESILTENQSVYIPYGSVHRIENPGKIDLEIIEVQSGAYLGEDDIVRFEDQYGRLSAAS